MRRKPLEAWAVIDGDGKCWVRPYDASVSASELKAAVPSWQFIRLVERDAVLEEAAQNIEGATLSFYPVGTDRLLDDVAKAIRALKSGGAP